MHRHSLPAGHLTGRGAHGDLAGALRKATQAYARPTYGGGASKSQGWLGAQPSHKLACLFILEKTCWTPSGK